MTVAIDTNVLLDLLIPDAPDAETSQRILIQKSVDNYLIVSEIVYAELAARMAGSNVLDDFLESMEIILEPSSREALVLAGHAWAEYTSRRPARFQCPACGNDQSVICDACSNQISPRQHALADFLIGAHAMVHADLLLTRDAGYFRTYFPSLRLEP